MPKHHVSVREALLQAVTGQGWDTNSVTEILLQYIEENCSSEDFAQFLVDKAHEENNPE